MSAWPEAVYIIKQISNQLNLNDRVLELENRLVVFAKKDSTKTKLTPILEDNYTFSNGSLWFVEKDEDADQIYALSVYSEDQGWSSFDYFSPDVDNISFTPSSSATILSGIDNIGDAINTVAEAVGGQVNVQDASKDVKGIVKIGNNIDVSSGTISLSQGTASKLGLVKLYTNVTGNNTDGAVSQQVIKNALAAKANSADVYSKTDIDSLISAVFKYKGTKTNVNEVLGLTGMTTGDVWFVTSDSSEYAYNGNAWERLGSTVDLSGYLTSVNVAGQNLTPGSNTITVDQLKTALGGIGAAAAKGVATSVASGNSNLVTSGAVYSVTNGLTTNVNNLTTNVNNLTISVNNLSTKVDNNNTNKLITLLASNWSSTAITTSDGVELYTQTINNGLTIYNENPTIGIGAPTNRTPQIPTSTQIEAFSLLYAAVANITNNSITFYVTEVPQTDFYVIAKGVK